MLRRLLKNRYLLPTAILVTVGFGGFVGLTNAGAQTGTHTSTPVPTLYTTGATTTTTQVAPVASASTGQPPSTTAGASHGGSLVSPVGATRTAPRSTASACRKELERISYTSPPNSGSPKTSSHHICVNGRIVAYGNSSIVYASPPKSFEQAGEELFEQVCSSCHMSDAQGGPAAPSLIGVGSGTVDFWVTTGRMPAATPLSVQAQTKPPKLSKRQAAEIAAWITSLSPAPPFIPAVNTRTANLATGASLFALNCAACHTITGAGDELAYGTNAPSLHYATTTQIAEAIRSGPGNMPRFTGNLSDSQVADIVAYVSEKLQHPTNSGGFGLGGICPVTEGFVALLFGVGGLMLICFWIGDRS